MRKWTGTIVYDGSPVRDVRPRLEKKKGMPLPKPDEKTTPDLNKEDNK